MEMLLFGGKNGSYFLVNEAAVKNLFEFNVFLSLSFVKFLTETLQKTSMVYEERLWRPNQTRRK